MTYIGIDIGTSRVKAIAVAGGPTASFRYWSASTDAGNPSNAWFALSNNGVVASDNKTFDYHVRAVRAGSCN